LVRVPVTEQAKPLDGPGQSSDLCEWQCDVDFEEDLISLFVEAAATIR